MNFLRFNGLTIPLIGLAMLLLMQGPLAYPAKTSGRSCPLDMIGGFHTRAEYLQSVDHDIAELEKLIPNVARVMDSIRRGRGLRSNQELFDHYDRAAHRFNQKLISLSTQYKASSFYLKRAQNLLQTWLRAQYAEFERTMLPLERHHSSSGFSRDHDEHLLKEIAFLSGQFWGIIGEIRAVLYFSKSVLAHGSYADHQLLSQSWGGSIPSSDWNMHQILAGRIEERRRVGVPTDPTEKLNFLAQQRERFPTLFSRIESVTWEGAIDEIARIEIDLIADSNPEMPFSKRRFKFIEAKHRLYPVNANSLSKRGGNSRLPYSLIRLGEYIEFLGLSESADLVLFVSGAGVEPAALDILRRQKYPIDVIEARKVFRRAR